MTWLLGRRLQGKFTMLPSFAAAMAFYFLVSLVPFLIVVSRGVAAVFSANLMPELLAFLRDVLPPESKFRPDALAFGQKGVIAVDGLIDQNEGDKTCLAKISQMMRRQMMPKA